MARVGAAEDPDCFNKNDAMRRDTSPMQRSLYDSILIVKGFTMKLAGILLCALFATACNSTYRRYSVNEMRFYISNHAIAHAHTGGFPGDKPVDTLLVNRGDSVFAQASAFRSNRWTLSTDHFYLCAIGADSLWVDASSLRTREELDCMRTGGIIKLPKSQSDDAWGRATVYVNKHATLRIQVASDNIIDTYNPVSDRNGVRSGSGYTITRRSIGDSVVIEIETKGTPIYGQCHAYQYIKYGN